MDLSRLKKVFAGVSATAILVSQIGVAVAAYSDVPSGIWYQDAVEAFLDAGYLDASQARFRGGDLANRAEFVKLVVELNGGILSTAPATPTFDDVARGAWYFGYFEESAKEEWVMGDGNCAGTHPCYARPSANINRAEAAAIIVRAFGLDQTGDAPTFLDVPSGQWFSSIIQSAADHCILQGDAGTSRVRPSDNMNRAEMVVMLNRVDQDLMYGEDCGEVAGEPMISDATATSTTTVEVDFNVSVDATAAKDKTKYAVTSPAQTISSIVVLSDDKVELTFATSLEANKEYTVTVTGMMTADGETFSDSATFSGFSSVPQGDGTLEVSTASKNPTGDTVPKGAVGVIMTSIDLTASDDDVVIDNIVVLHEGFGDTADISGVYAMVNGERVTRKRSLDSQTTTATIRFSTPLVIPAGKTVTLDIAADIASAATTSGEHALTVELPSDIQSNALQVTGNFPMRGATFRIAAVSAGAITVTYRSVTPTKVQVGENKAKLGRFELSLNSVEDQTIYSMTIENDGTTSDGDVTGLQIRRTDGTVVTNTVAQTVGDFATFVFDPPFTILQGDKITLDVVGDIVGGAAKNVKMHFDEASDIFSVGSLYGYGVNGQLYGSLITLPTETSTLPSTVSIDAGQFTINLNGPSTQNYTPDDKDAVLANLNFATGGEDVDIEELYIAIQGTTSTGAAFEVGRAIGTTGDEIHEALEGVELRNKTTGQTISAVRLLTADTHFNDQATTGVGTGAFQIYRLDDFTVRGSEEYEVRVDFIDTSSTTNAAPSNGDRFRVHLCGEATHELDSSNALVANTTGCSFGGLITSSTTYQIKITGASTGDRVGDVRPGGTISGNFQDIKTSSLTITGRAGASTDTTVKNAKNVNLLRFEARASEAKDVLITTLIFETAAATLNNAQNYALWVDTNGDGNVDTVVASGESAQSNAITFDSIEGGGYIIPKESTVVFEVHGDMSSSLSETNAVLQIRFDTGATFVGAEEVDNGSSISGIQYTNPGGTTAVIASGCTANTTCNIVVTTATATRYTIRNAGDLYVTKSVTPVRNRQLLGGTLENEILRLKLHADYEDIEVTDLVFTATGSSAGAGSGNFITNVRQLELYKAGATTPFVLATRASCQTGVAANSMCADMNNQQLIVTKGGDVDILIRPRMNTDVDGATAGHLVALQIDKTPTSWSGTGSVRARGLLSSNTLAKNDEDATAEGEVFVGISSAAAPAYIQGNEHRVVLAKALSITNANPDANGSAIPSGTQPIGQFKFTVAPHSNSKNGLDDWTLSGVIFNVTATNIVVGTGASNRPALYNKLDNSAAAKHSCIATGGSWNSANSGVTGSFYVVCKGLRSGSGGTVNTRITPGSDATFVLEMNVLNPSITGANQSTLQVSLTSFTDLTASNFATTGGHISWSDIDNSSTTTFRWVEYPETTVNSTSYSG